MIAFPVAARQEQVSRLDGMVVLNSDSLNEVFFIFMGHKSISSVQLSLSNFVSDKLNFLREIIQTKKYTIGFSLVSISIDLETRFLGLWY